MKNILVILGGGRPRGNTRQLVDAFVKGAVDAGHQTEVVSLNEKQVNGCIMPVAMAKLVYRKTILMI